MNTLDEIKQELANFDGKPCKKCGNIVFWDEWIMNGNMCKRCKNKLISAGIDDSDVNDIW